MPVTLTSISPLSGPPGTVVTLTGAGFDAGSRVACPVLVPTTLVNAETLTAAIPVDLAGPAGGTMQVGMFVMGSDNSVSAVLPFTVMFDADRLQGWTTIDAVCGMVPGFARGVSVSDDRITEWVQGNASEIAAVMAKRNLPIDPTQWPGANLAGMPSPAEMLEQLNRLGAAADLASAVCSLWGQREWDVAKGLQEKYDAGMMALREGEYDNIFLASAVTVEPGVQFGGCSGWGVFRKEKVF